MTPGCPHENNPETRQRVLLMRNAQQQRQQRAGSDAPKEEVLSTEETAAVDTSGEVEVLEVAALPSTSVGSRAEGEPRCPKCSRPPEVATTSPYAPPLP